VKVKDIGRVLEASRIAAKLVVERDIEVRDDFGTIFYL